MKNAHSDPIDVTTIRNKLASVDGPDYWRCLEELADTEGFREMVHREFPRMASVWQNGISRREFIALMGASLALTGLTGCGVRPPTEQIVPYVRAPEQIVPGKPLFYATALQHAGRALGVLVETHEGRPTKVEGNPDHPASMGASDIFAQASILTMYDPDRSQNVMHRDRIATWSDVVRVLRAAADRMRENRDGSGLRLLTETTTSPTLARQIQSLLEELPGAVWHQYEPVNRDSAREGARLAFGEDRNTYYDFEHADVVLSLDCDFLVSEPGSVRYARQFMNRRRAALDAAGSSDCAMNRLYLVEPCPSSTGAKADHRWPMQAKEVEVFARAVAGSIDEAFASGTVSPPSLSQANLQALVNDLKTHHGRSVIVAGGQQSPIVHALAHAMNDRLGNVGTTVFYTRSVAPYSVDQNASVRELIDEMKHGHVEMLVILGGNPAYSAPADLDFATHLAALDEQGRPKVPLRVRLGLYEDETSELCDWHVPQAHPFESWSDIRAFDGTATIVQPLIAPLYDGKSCHEVIATLTEPGTSSGYDLVRATWRRHWKKRGESSDFEYFWQTSLHEGTISGTAFESIESTLQFEWLEKPTRGTTERGSLEDEEDAAPTEIVFRPDPCIFDGCFSNNGWLQELPKPLTKTTWDNAAMISPATAEKHGLTYEVAGHGGEHGAIRADVIELECSGRKIEAPAWILPGHADDSITVHLGYGRTRAGRVGTAVGVNAYRLRSSSAPWADAGLTIRKTGRKHLVACTQQHHLMEGRKIVRSTSLADYWNEPDSFVGSEQRTEGLPSLYPQQEYPYEGYKWGMSIDLSSCVGCNACVVACQAENNIPVVGKDQVTRGREMHWIRLDRYYQGGLDSPITDFQPVPCMHCENAPCELVCPVGATVHSDEGLNDMIYNRCVGTRYCSNNCPYKVRRFNFLEYAHADWDTPVTNLLRNPDVTVRSRGVMEKCTYCVQRINHARIEAEKENRSIRDGDVVTACQGACPAKAIHFGDLNDRDSEVVRQKQSPRSYGLLTELNTRPRTTYLGIVRNPNPEIRDG